MPRSLQPRQPSNGSGDDPADREPGRNDAERAHLAHKLRDGGDHDDYDGDDYDHDGARELLTGDRLSRLPTRDDRDDDVEPLADDDPDIMEVLDLDDLNQMDGPDA